MEFFRKGFFHASHQALYAASESALSLEQSLDGLLRTTNNQL